MYAVGLWPSRTMRPFGEIGGLPATAEWNPVRKRFLKLKHR
jgi:hypothetical protein